ncbi:uncharacterized protein LOC109711573 [Ananas comosus]|uniref:Uncharacterized protein LOC109711573 n=1 Tax=Ananas comosus TaxID=4615 RepID=A0A6P5FA12_ANACO|nr:uncharacterized protein LOC109711573 [Ananas comosus]XP_020090299.1 uncharacterized protein LOC109711573 [Ananas comosus]
MKANMAKRFKNDSLLDKFYCIGSALTSVQYYKLKDELLALDQDAWKWVDELEVYKEYWAWAFDGGRRFGLMTTNMSKSLNRVFKGIRAIPVTVFVAETFYKLNSCFIKRRENGKSMTATLAPKIQSRITMNMVTARGHLVYRFGPNEFEVQTGHSDYNVTLNGTQADCDCGEFKLTGIPCSHILTVCSNSQLRIDYHSLCFHWYTVECYCQTYAPLFHPVSDRRYWPRPQGPPIVPPPVRRKKGRPRSTRIRNIMDETSGRRTKYSICKQGGHYRNTCPQNTEIAQQGRRHLEETGPVDKSVLTEQHLHRSSFIKTEEYRGVQFIEHGRKLNQWVLDHPAVLDLLRQSEFYYISRLRRLQLDQALLGALIERWRRETQTFHFRHGEMTITLQDVAVISGLRVDGAPVTGTTVYPWSDICQALLGVVPDDIRAGQIRFDLIYQQFHHLHLDAPAGLVAATARAYILYQIGCSLFPDPTGYRVHLK